MEVYLQRHVYWLVEVSPPDHTQADGISGRFSSPSRRYRVRLPNCVHRKDKEMCDYTEPDPDGGLAHCTRDDDHYGIHLVKRKNGGTYLETLGVHKMMLGDFDKNNPKKINKRP